MSQDVWVDGFIQECRKEGLSDPQIIQEANDFFGDDMDKLYREGVQEALDYICLNCEVAMFYDSKSQTFVCPTCD